ncbi:unnamed protein product [Pelagomonas calceolata]|uniref:Uncharacterized protein n=1 Tax=Pelagomonas calceolata TaxID=35677 RepID=A0A8J2SYB2_9STRA|nr:unnamed protein product [Pelagomonas calceolata]
MSPSEPSTLSRSSFGRKWCEPDLQVQQTSTLYADALHLDPAATLDDLREAVATLEEIEPTARRVLGGAHPTTTLIDESLRRSLVTLGAALRARGTPSLPENAADD